MRTLSLSVAAVFVLSASPAAAGVFSGGGFNLSFLDDLLGEQGIEVDLPEIDIELPPQAESAVSEALDQAEAALDRVFGDGGSLDETNVEEIIQDALEDAESVLEGISLPEVDLPEIDLPDVDQIIEDALGDAQESVDSALERVFGDGGILDEIDDLVPVVEDVLDDLTTDLGDELEELLGESGIVNVVDEILSDLPIDRLPDVAIEAIENAAGILEKLFGGSEPEQEIQATSFQSVAPISRSSAFMVLPSTSSTTSVPEPSACLLAATCLAAFSARLRR